MNYLQISSRPRKKTRLVFILLLFAVLFVTVLNLFGANFLPGFLYKTGGPLWRAEAFWENTIGRFADFVTSKDSLGLENIRLSQELRTMQEHLFVSEELERQNAEMKSLLGRTDEKRKVFATVLAGPPASPYDVLILDVGAKHGLAVGDKVITSGGSVIGELSSVFNDYSKADLYSSPGKILSVFIGEEGFNAEANGLGGGTFEVVLPKEQAVNVGQAVYFASGEPLLVGTVDHVFTRDVDFLKLVLISSLENIYELRYVGVIASSTDVYSI